MSPDVIKNRDFLAQNALYNNVICIWEQRKHWYLQKIERKWTKNMIILHETVLLVYHFCYRLVIWFAILLSEYWIYAWAIWICTHKWVFQRDWVPTAESSRTTHIIHCMHIAYAYALYAPAHCIRTNTDS